MRAQCAATAAHIAHSGETRAGPEQQPRRSEHGALRDVDGRRGGVDTVNDRGRHGVGGLARSGDAVRRVGAARGLGRLDRSRCTACT